MDLKEIMCQCSLTNVYRFQYSSKATRTCFVLTYLLTYPNWAHVPQLLWVQLFVILRASLQALWFEVRSFDNFKDFKSQLMHCCQVFLGQSRPHLPATSCCVHFFIQPSLQQTWPNQCKPFVCSVISRFFKHSLFNKLSDDILSLIFILNIQRIIACLFCWGLWTSAVVTAQHSLL